MDACPLLRFRDDLIPEARMAAHLLPFLGRQRAGLSQDEVAHADLADVVDRGQPGEVVDRLRSEEVVKSRMASEALTQGLHVALGTEQMSAGVVIAGARERRQRMEKEIPGLSELPRGAVGPPSL